MYRGLAPRLIPMFLNLPIALEEPAAPVAVAPNARRILVIDDDEMLRRAISIYLRLEGHIVEVLCDASSAAARVAAGGHHLVITDIFMPNCDGLEAISKIRKDHPKIGIVVMSGGDIGGTSFLRAAQLMGATHVLQKPFDFSELGKIVRGIPVQTAA